MAGFDKRAPAHRSLFYAGGGPGDFIRAHRKWREGVPDSKEISKTFSGQVADYCEAHVARAYLVSPHPEPAQLEDGRFLIEHRPKPFPDASGLLYELRELWYGFRLARSAARFEADVVVVDSGATTFPAMLLFKRRGAHVVCVLHNTLWPKGHPPTRWSARLRAWLSGLFFRYGADAVIGVSPECIRQVEALAGDRTPTLVEARAQFWPATFEEAPDPPSFDSPFTVLYVGRIDETKGVFDIVEMAERLERRWPGRFRFEIWGEGEALEALRRSIEQREMSHVVRAPGYLLPEDAVAARARSHVGLVPTRSSFNEGMAMTAIESILARRPLIASSAVPAAEVLASASIECPADDVDSFVTALETLAGDQERYMAMVAACDGLKSTFFERGHGLEAAIDQAVESIGRDDGQRTR